MFYTILKMITVVFSTEKMLKTYLSRRLGFDTIRFYQTQYNNRWLLKQFYRLRTRNPLIATEQDIDSLPTIRLSLVDTQNTRKQQCAKSDQATQVQSCSYSTLLALSVLYTVPSFSTFLLKKQSNIRFCLKILI